MYRFWEVFNLKSNEFKQNIQRVIENYNAGLQQLNTEKKWMMKNWAKREKQIWVIEENMNSFIGSINGIARQELGVTDMLELPKGETEQ